MYRTPCTFDRSIRIVQTSTSSPLSILLAHEGKSWQLPVIRRVKGPYLYDYDENRYVDFDLAGGSLLLGHSHPGITKVIKSWLGRGYSPGYPTAAHRMLSTSLEAFLVDGPGGFRPGDGKWCFFDSTSEACSALLFLLKSMRSIEKGCYVTGGAGGRASGCFRPYVGTLLSFLQAQEVCKDGMSDFGYFVLHCDRLTEKQLLVKLIKMLKDHGKLIISDETDFASHLHFTRLIDDISLADISLIDARVFGNWLCGGLSFGCFFGHNGLFRSLVEEGNGTMKKGRCGEEQAIYEYLPGIAGLPPLFKLKTAVHFLGMVKKRGGVNALCELRRRFFSLLDPRYFELISDAIYLSEVAFERRGFTPLRRILLEQGLYIPISFHAPLSVSFAHEAQLLSKCAGLMNEICYNEHAAG